MCLTLGCKARASQRACTSSIATSPRCFSRRRGSLTSRRPSSASTSTTCSASRGLLGRHFLPPPALSGQRARVSHFCPGPQMRRHSGYVSCCLGQCCFSRVWREMEAAERQDDAMLNPWLPWHDGTSLLSGRRGVEKMRASFPRTAELWTEGRSTRHGRRCSRRTRSAGTRCGRF